ncbi:Fc.00g026170.m01.CDS01 [Cosmosporella sp. VM-42]
MAKLSLAEVDSIDIHVLINDEIDQISPSPNVQVQHAQSFAGVPLDMITDPATRGGAKMEMPMHNICCGAHGLSLFITATKDGVKNTLLFDTGPEGDVLERNAKRLRLPMGDVDAIALSHWHRDHSGGLLSAIKLINEEKRDSDPVLVDVPLNRPEYRGVMFHEPISLEPDPTLNEIKEVGGRLQGSNGAHMVVNSTYFVSGEIPRQTAYEGGIPGGIRFENGKWETDELIMEERYVMCKIKGKGLVIFTGCSHAGLINIAKDAKEVDDSPIHAIVGGYHLADADNEKMHRSMADLKELGPALLMPGHCTGWRFKGLIEKEMPGQMAPIFGGTKYTL